MRNHNETVCGTSSTRSDATRGSGAAHGHHAGRFNVGKHVLFSVIIVGGLLLGSEAAIRGWVFFFRTSYERYDLRTGRLQLVPNVRYRNSQGREFWINSKGFVGPEFDDRPGDGVYRIIALGDSCTFATGFWQIGYPSILEALLNDRALSRRFEVINAGIEGYNSAFALARIRDELLGYQPRLMIVYIGWNDLMKTDPANATHVDDYSWLAEFLDRSYLIKAYKKLLFVNVRPLLLSPDTADDSPAAHAFDHFIPNRLRATLEKMVQVLKQHGVKPLLVTLPTVVRAGMTAAELRRAHVFFPYFPGAYGVPELLSLHRAYNRTIVAVAREEGVEVVDLASVFEGIEDRTSYFWDTMHPNEKGNALIARTLRSRIRQLESEGRL